LEAVEAHLDGSRKITFQFSSSRIQELTKEYLSGSATVREHVQRLGRILRPASGKLAILYEVLSEGTSEEHTSARRRQHDAYR
jgi:hypothetical protein